jgi:hypothetical protein
MAARAPTSPGVRRAVLSPIPSPICQTWEITDLPSSPTRLSRPHPIRVDAIDLYFSCRLYPDQSQAPFGISVKAKGHFPPSGFQFRIKFSIAQLPPVERTLRLFSTVPSDTVYFLGVTMEFVFGLFSRSKGCLSVGIEIAALASNSGIPRLHKSESARSTPVGEMAPVRAPPVDTKTDVPVHQPVCSPGRAPSSARSRRSPYVGLANQGATCYMNSVLQSLFHLTKFRDIVYQMPTEDVEDAASSIPLNLQALFLNMERRIATCTTRDLTVSFGWDEVEAFVQHDIQEFLRVLLSKIEEIMRETVRKDAIAELFRGKFRHSIWNK